MPYIILSTADCREILGAHLIYYLAVLALLYEKRLNEKQVFDIKLVCMGFGGEKNRDRTRNL